MTLAEGEMRGCLGEKWNARGERERDPAWDPTGAHAGSPHCSDDSDRGGMLSLRARTCSRKLSMLGYSSRWDRRERRRGLHSRPAHERQRCYAADADNRPTTYPAWHPSVC